MDTNDHTFQENGFMQFIRVFASSLPLEPLALSFFEVLEVLTSSLVFVTLPFTVVTATLVFNDDVDAESLNLLSTVTFTTVFDDVSPWKNNNK